MTGISPVDLLNALRTRGVEHFVGVPDSLLKRFCDHMVTSLPPEAHVITANEGGAVGMAIGHFLGTGSPSLVYLQNSGLGNAINPLMSLADPDVYGIPMVLLIGWRGEPGQLDEPQHVAQGRVTPALLDALQIPYAVLDEDADPDAVCHDIIQRMTERSGPVALLVRAGTFVEVAGSPPGLRPPMSELSREDAIRCVVAALPSEAVVVATTGHISRELFEVRAEQRGAGAGADFLTVGGMGHASSIALALACARPTRRVVCLDGDGALLMHLGALPIVGDLGPPNLTHIVLNNGVHESVGGQPTVGFDIDMPAMAIASGYLSAVTVDDSEQLDGALAQLAERSGPDFIEVRVRRGARSDLGRPTSTPRENRDALMTALGL